MLVGKCPGKEEIERGRPFVGAAGYLLDTCLEDAKINRSELYLTNIYKYPIYDDNLVPDQEAFDIFWQEVNDIKPKVIVALGNVPLKLLTGQEGIRNFRGSVLKTNKGMSWTIPSYNPAAILRNEDGSQGYWQKYMISMDLRKAKRISEDPFFRLPQRLLRFATSEDDVHQFFWRNRHNSYAAADIETFNSFPSCISFAFSRYEAFSIPLFPKMFGIEITRMTAKELVPVWRHIDKALREKNIIGQNFKFDEERLISLGFRVPHFHFDTMLAASVLDPEFPKSQAFLTSVYTDEPYYKEEGKGFNPKKDKIDRHLLYNAKDSAIDFEIYEKQLEELKKEKLDDFYFNFEHKLHKLYLKIDMKGMRILPSIRQDLKTEYDFRVELKEKEFFERVGYELNVNSPKQVLNYIVNDLKVNCLGTDEKQLTALFNNRIKKPRERDILMRILELRKLKKALSTYVEAEPDWDGRMKTSYRIIGTETGRTSTSVLKPPVRHKRCGLAFQTITKHGDIGSDIRKMFIPDTGKIFMQIDLSQAEARVVTHLADDIETLRMFDTIDIHKKTASWIFGKDMSAITKDERFIGKSSRHGGNYGLQKRTFAQDTNMKAKKYGINLVISEWRAGEILEIFHKHTPSIKGVFQRGIIEELRRTRRLISPNGRKRTFYERLNDDLYREGFAQIPQSTVTDHTKECALIIDEEYPEVDILLESHDALFMQVPEKEYLEYAKELKPIFERPIDFVDCSLSRGMLVIPCEIEIGYNAKDMNELKV